MLKNRVCVALREMSWSLAGLALLLSSLLSGCQTAPTTVRETPERQMRSAERMMEPIRITPETIVIDARSRFDYSVAHIPRSIPLQWSDFTEPEAGQRGILQKDTFAITRRLARSGIGPSTPVVVVGYGRAGGGEEGRMAWMLAYLGVEQVQFAHIDSFKARMSNAVEDDFPKPVPIWKPDVMESLNVTRQEVKFSMNQRAMHQPASYQGGVPALYRLIDVRSERGYMNREGLGARKPIPNMEAINIPWQEFFTNDLRPSREVAQRLREVGVLPEHRIIVIDEGGVASAAVTMALRALGFSKAGNYSGGLNDLTSSR
jgi:3-mercaptopyruvate sulfurtransferase SseA